MQIYTGIISKNIAPYSSEDPYLNDHVRVRITDFHGPKTETAYTSNFTNDQISQYNITDDEDLPWALVNRGFEDNTWSAQSFNEGDLVYVLLKNQDVKSPIIIGFASRFSYTEDITIAQDNYLYKTPGTKILGQGLSSNTEFAQVVGANNIVSVAQNEVGYVAKKSDSDLDTKSGNPYSGEGTKYTKYMKYATGNSAGEWCAAFCAWVYNQAGYGEYFCGGQKTVGVLSIMNYYKSNSPNSVATFSSWSNLKAKAGDLVIFDWDPNNGNGVDHIGLVCQDQADTDEFIMTIEGNTKGDSDGVKSAVAKKKRTGYVNCIIRTGVPIVQSTGIINGTDNETQVWNALVSTIRIKVDKEDKRLNNAAICGILGNFKAETSGFNPTESCIDSNNKQSYGLAQWNGDRFTSLKDWCSKNSFNYDTIDGQIAYLNYELNNGYYNSVGVKLLDIPNTKDGAGTAAKLFADSFEVCGESYKPQRIADAKDLYWPKYGNVTLVDTKLEPYKTLETTNYDMPSDNTVLFIANSKNKTLDIYSKSGTDGSYKKSLNFTSVKFKETTPGLYNIGLCFGLATCPGGVSTGKYFRLNHDSTLCHDYYDKINNKFCTFIPDDGNAANYIHFNDNKKVYNYGILIMGETSSNNLIVGSGMFITGGDTVAHKGISISDANLKKIYSILGANYVPQYFSSANEMGPPTAQILIL